MQSANIEALLDEICQKIGGDWLLLGGSLVLLEYDGARATEDIDLVQIRASGKSEVKAQDELFQAAFRLGMDPESVNSAARFFVGEFKGWEHEIRELRRGSAGCVYKPTLTLFVASKLSRATETDLRDIELAIQKEGVGAFDEKRFRDLSGPAVQANFDRLRTRFRI